MKLGDVLGERFVLQRIAGSGGMGHVYEALDQRAARRVAVKVLLGSHRDDVARFAREAMLLAQLNHPHIVRSVTYDVLPSGEPYLVMEWLDGEDLAARVARGRLSVNDTIALGVGVADALGFAHARGIIHRDLKPANLFLPGGRIEDVKILDFGIAQLGGEAQITRTGALLGTPSYMAPEQARGERQLSPHADVFSLGCVLFECLTGEPAFAAHHPMAVLAKILFEEPPRLRDRHAGLPDALEALVERMLSKTRDVRPQDGRAVADALDAIGRATPRPAETMQAPEKPRPVLTHNEQRPVAVILLGKDSFPKGPAHASRETVSLGDLGSLREVAARYGGDLEPMLDGSVVVVLRSVTVATDLAVHAARCALSLREHDPYRPIAMTVGRTEATVRVSMGQAIDRAAQLIEGKPSSFAGEESAPILIDEFAAGLLETRFNVQTSEAGLALHGERDLSEGTRTLLGKATPCVGRGRELRHLEALFRECVEESIAQAALVTAPPGIGKSRLAQELLSILRARGEAAIWIGRGDPLRMGAALGLLGQAIRSACGIRDGEPLDARRTKLAARVAERIAEPHQRRVTEFLSELIGAPLLGDESMQLSAARRDAQLMSDQMREAFCDFVAAECEARPVVIVLEDLHWGDPPTAQFIDRALRELSEKPLLILALARPEVHDLFPKLWSGRRMHSILLNALSKKAIEGLARLALGERVTAETINRLARLSEGNAFYLEELIRATAEGKREDLPETLVAMVQSRLAALSERARRLLRAASVFGEVFWASGAAALVGDEARRAGVLEQLAELDEQELVTRRKESRFPGEEEYAFRHALLREGAYAMLTDEDRMLGHRLAGGWLEQHGEQEALVLAHHFEQGGDGARAGAFYLRASELAHASGDGETARAHAERGLACPVSDESRVGLMVMACEVSVWRPHEWADAAARYVDELMRIARPNSVAWVQAMLIKLLGALTVGRLDVFIECLEILTQIDPRPGALGPLSSALSIGGYLLDVIGLIEKGNAVGARLTALVREAERPDPLATVLMDCTASGRSAYALEDPWTGLHQARSAADLAGKLRHQRYFFGGYVLAAMHLRSLGRFEEARRTLDAIPFQSDEMGFGSGIHLFVAAWTLLDCGMPEAARERAGRLLELSHMQKLSFDEGRAHWALAEVLRRAGELEEAEREVQAALALLSLASPLDYPAALATAAAVRLARGRPAEALSAAEEGLGRYDAMGACGFFRGAALRLIHAECLDATGDREGAQAAIAKARESLLFNANKIGEPEVRGSFLENVEENRRTLELARIWLGEGP